LQVLFRNNLALSRDITITGLFQSFQSSSTVLDPKANPPLFQSTLIIPIKVRCPRSAALTGFGSAGFDFALDTVDSDNAEIAKERVFFVSSYCAVPDSRHLFLGSLSSSNGSFKKSKKQTLFLGFM
jgi:hypothetical protein